MNLASGGFTVSFSPTVGDQTVDIYYVFLCAKVNGDDDTEFCQLKTINVEDENVSCDQATLNPAIPASLTC